MHFQSVYGPNTDLQSLQTVRIVNMFYPFQFQWGTWKVVNPTNEMHFSFRIGTEWPFYGPDRPLTAFMDRIRLCMLDNRLQEAQILYYYYYSFWYMSDD